MSERRETIAVGRGEWKVSMKPSSSVQRMLESGVGGGFHCMSVSSPSERHSTNGSASVVRAEAAYQGGPSAADRMDKSFR